MEDKSLQMTDEDWAIANELQSFLWRRLSHFEGLRNGLDRDIKDEIDAYNGVDKRINAMPDHFEKVKMPVVYSQVQTIVSRLIKSFFDGNNYLKIEMESDEFEDIQPEVTKWAQEEMDKVGLKYKARDFLEQALVSRTSWLVLRPVPSAIMREGKEYPGYRLEFDVHPFRDVWFDTKARTTGETDFFVKKIVPIYKFFERPDMYFNLDQVQPVSDPFFDRTGSTQAHDLNAKNYMSQNSSSASPLENGPSYQEGDENNRGNGMSEVEIHEYFGTYDFSDKQPGEAGYVPDVREIIATIANRRTLIRWEFNTIKLDKKRLIFPIRPISQASNLVGKSLPQLVKEQQHQYNLAQTLRMTNYNNQVGMLFKYNKNADIDIDEIFNGSGNMIGWDENPDDIEIFNQPNLIGESNAMISEIMNNIQSVTGAVDSITGGGAGVPDTARGQQQMTNEAMLKFQMMSENIHIDLREFINYSLILLIKYNKEQILLKHPTIGPFLDQSMEELEKNYAFDINLRDNSIKRDVEQAQWANMVGIIGPMVQQNGGNMSYLTKELLKVFGMKNPEKVMEPESAEQIVTKMQSNPQLAAEVQNIIAAQAAEEQGATNPAGPSGSPAPVQTQEAQSANKPEIS